MAPDFAITLNTQTSEAKALEYVWPEFVWVNVSAGFTDYGKTKAFDDTVKLGEACGLDVGYDAESDSEAHWPAFCVENSEQKLQGRFGDPLWRYLQLRLYRCAPLRGEGGGGGRKRRRREES